MEVFVALYQGINVGGRNSVKMESLRALHARLGHQKVSSYIQSGNLVFSAHETAETIAEEVAEEFLKGFGFASRVAVLSAKRLAKIVKDNPYAKIAAENPTIVHAGICQGEPQAKGLKDLLARTGGNETFVVGKGIIYLHAPDGFGTSKFAAGMAKASGVPMTVRNWRTIETLWRMVDANPGS